jgi:hypothetical protein
MEQITIKETNLEQVYRHSEIGDLEEDATSLIEKLKDKIDQGFYTLLVSDETGGRLPTLLVRSIIKKIHPKANLQTLFINGGKMLHMLIQDDKPDEETSFTEYIKFITEEHNNALVVTQVMRSGSSLAILASMLKNSGCNHVDVATIRSVFDDIIYSEDKNRIGSGEVFIGKEYADTNEFDDKNRELSGVTKVEGSVVHPNSIKKLVGEDEAKKQQIQATINEARDDIKIMADRIYRKVWHK